MGQELLKWPFVAPGCLHLYQSTLRAWKGGLWVLGYKASRLALLLQVPSVFLGKCCVLDHLLHVCSTTHSPTLCLVGQQDLETQSVASVSKRPLARRYRQWSYAKGRSH